MAGLCLWDPLGLPHQQSNPASVRASVLSHFAQAMHGTNWILNGAMGLSFKSMGDFPASHGGWLLGGMSGDSWVWTIGKHPQIWWERPLSLGVPTICGRTYLVLPSVPKSPNTCLEVFLIFLGMFKNHQPSKMDGQGPLVPHSSAPQKGPLNLRPSATGPGKYSAHGDFGSTSVGMVDCHGVIQRAMPVSSQTKRISTWRTHVLLFYTTNLLGCFNLRSTQTQKNICIQWTQNTQKYSK